MNFRSMLDSDHFKIGERIETNPDFRSFVSSLERLNFSRQVVVLLFMQNILNSFESKQDLNVALVGGSENDPEIYALRELGFDFELIVFGIENADIFLDLNAPSYLDTQFDLVICSQVLEHTWNSVLALETLCKMVKPNGKLWISVPTSNRKHASPEYFSAGYTSNFLDLNCSQQNMKVLFSTDFGSKREYAARHLLPIWLTKRGHKFPLLFAFEGKTLLIRVALSFMHLPTLIYLHFASSKLFAQSKYSAETVFLASKSF